MKKQLRIYRSRAILPLLALVISTSPMFATVTVSSGTAAISCNIQSSTTAVLTQTAHPITVRLSASPSAASVITATPASAALLVTQNVAGNAGKTLASGAVAGTSALWSAGVVFNIDAQQYCANAAATGANSVIVNFVGTGTGNTTPVPVTVTLTVATAAYTPAVTPSATVSLACNTGTGSTAKSVNLTLPYAPPPNSSVVFAIGAFTKGGSAVTEALSPLVVSVPATAQIPSAFAGIPISINAQPLCANASAGTTAQTFVVHPTITGAPTGVTVPDTTITVNLTVAAGPSTLSVSPSAISINCTWDGTPGASHYTPGQAKFVSVTAAAATVFSVNAAVGTSTALNWATLDKTASAVSATSVPYNFTVAAKDGCGANEYGSYAGTIHLTNAPSLDKIINVTLNIVHSTLLKSTVVDPTLTYIKGSGTPGYLDVKIVAISGDTVPVYFTVDTGSLPTWLTVDATSGTTPRSLRFTSTSMADSMAPGSYHQLIRVQTLSNGDLMVNIPMQVSNPPSALTVSGTATAGCTVTGPTQNCSWTIGQPLPNLYITLKSSDAPLAYSIKTSGTLAPIIPDALLGGLAYSFGATIPVTFNQSVFSGVAPGTMLSGTVSITSGSPATTYVVTFNITAQAPGAILTGISPTIVPILSPGQQVKVVLIGSGFVRSSDVTQATMVGIVNAGGTFGIDTNFSVDVLNASNILLTITVPSQNDPLLDFATATTFPVTIGVCNPAGTACTSPTGTVVLTIGAKPIIQTVTSASSYVQTDTATPVSPFDMISIFGTNLCASCVGTNAIMYGAPQSPNLGYPNSLSNTDANATRTLQVAFQTHAATPDAIPPTAAGETIPNSPVYASLLFATNNQINLLVPAAVSAAIEGTDNKLVDLVVSFGPAGGTPVTSNVYPMTAVLSNPGLFTIAASGQGNGAILDKHYAVVGQTNPVAMHAAVDSDPVMIYMTGLGAPASANPNTAEGGSVWATDCISTGAYTTALGNVTGTSPTTVDGLILQSSLINKGNFVPCLDATTQLPDVTIGGKTVLVTYAGWVADSIVGLYQVNGTLPSTSGTFNTATADCHTFDVATEITDITRPTQLPVCVKSKDGKYSQSGVMIWVAPRLVVDAPVAASGTPLILTEKVGAALSATDHAVIATEGSGSGYTYAITSGVLPSGLSLATDGTISGVSAMGTVGSYPITVTATDTSSPAITGTVSFTVQVGAGLFLTSDILLNGTHASTAQTGGLTATGGVGPYVYSIGTGTLPSPLVLNANGTVTGTATAVSTVTVTFHVHDSSTPQLTGDVSITFAII